MSAFWSDEALGRLYELYVEQGLDARQVARRFRGVSHRDVTDKAVALGWKRGEPAASRSMKTDTVSVRVGHWFEACATGRGVFVVPALLLVAVIALGLKMVLHG